MNYGQLPIVVGKVEVECQEMMFYQYLPIKLIGQTEVRYEERLECFSEIINACLDDYCREFGYDDITNTNIYLTAKRMYQTPGTSFNRKGYHSDGFMTNDINYIWSDVNPTEFNTADFKLTMDDVISMKEMEQQASKMKAVFEDKVLLRLDQFNIHRVPENEFEGFRTFVKVSFSKDKYDLKGNSINRLLNYNWKMRDREIERNIPQKIN